MRGKRETAERRDEWRDKALGLYLTGLGPASIAVRVGEDMQRVLLYLLTQLPEHEAELLRETYGTVIYDRQHYHEGKGRKVQGGVWRINRQREKLRPRLRGGSAGYITELGVIE